MILELEDGEAALVLSPDSTIQVALPEDGTSGDHVSLVWMLAKLLERDVEFPNYVANRLQALTKAAD